MNLSFTSSIEVYSGQYLTTCWPTSFLNSVCFLDRSPKSMNLGTSDTYTTTVVFSMRPTLYIVRFDILLHFSSTNIHVEPASTRSTLELQSFFS